MPTMPSFASAAEKAALAPSRTAMFAVARDSLARTRSSGYVAPAVSISPISWTGDPQTATMPAPAPALRRKGVERTSSPDHCERMFLNAPYEVN